MNVGKMSIHRWAQVQSVIRGSNLISGLGDSDHVTLSICNIIFNILTFLIYSSNRCSPWLHAPSKVIPSSSMVLASPTSMDTPEFSAVWVWSPRSMLPLCQNLAAPCFSFQPLYNTALSHPPTPGWEQRGAEEAHRPHQAAWPGESQQHLEEMGPSGIGKFQLNVSKDS